MRQSAFHCLQLTWSYSINSLSRKHAFHAICIFDKQRDVHVKSGPCHIKLLQDYIARAVPSDGSSLNPPVFKSPS